MFGQSSVGRKKNQRGNSLKNFEREISTWFRYASSQIKLGRMNSLEAKQKFLIKVVLRVIFLYFLKELKIIPPEILAEDKVKSILNLRDAQKSTYYKAILQNLFFGILNNEKVSSRIEGLKYKNYFKNELEIERVFSRIPFINCSFFEIGDEHYDDKDAPLFSVPDELFFNKTKDNREVRGLLHILNQYKFTVEEDFHCEDEFALSPEILGKVFENLLAINRTELGTTARKSTGSFYTPRKIVNYMVDECIIAYLDTKLTEKFQKNDFKEKLKQLVSLSGKQHKFNNRDQKLFIIESIANMKILDPACGSGAFLIGMLKKLNHILQKLDPTNSIWKQEVIQRIPANIRERTKISLENCPPNYVRKLGIIESCIYGVDIQPMAIQICKLRFLISLLGEQKIDDLEQNRNFKALPNLETKFIAANTIISIDTTEINKAKCRAIKNFKNKLQKIRKELFFADNYLVKKKLQQRDIISRQEIINALAENYIATQALEQIFSWNPFEQNEASSWFDAGLMFGTEHCFAIVISNPPYVKKENLESSVVKQIEKNFYENINGTQKHWSDDLYVHFIFKGLELTENKGILCYITNDSFIGLKLKERVRKLLLKHNLCSIIRCPVETFDAMIYTAIFLLRKSVSANKEYESGCFSFPEFKYKSLGKVPYEVVANLPHQRFLFGSPIIKLFKKLISLDKVKNYLQVLDTGIHTGNVREKIFFREKVNNGLQRLLQGRQIARWGIFGDRKGAKFRYCDINYVPKKLKGKGRKGQPSKHYEYWHFCGNIENHHQPERLLMRQSDDDLIVAYHSEKEFGRFYTDNTLFTILPKDKRISLKYALAILNSKLLNSIHQFISQEAGKTLAQVKIGLVEELPFIIGNQQPFIELVDKILSICKDADFLENDVKQAKVREIETQIDIMVYKLFALVADDCSIIDPDFDNIMNKFGLTSDDYTQNSLEQLANNFSWISD